MKNLIIGVISLFTIFNSFGFDLDMTGSKVSIIGKKVIKLKNVKWDGSRIGGMELTWDASNNTFKITSISNEDPPDKFDLKGSWSVDYDHRCDGKINHKATLVVAENYCKYNSTNCSIKYEDKNRYRLVWEGLKGYILKGNIKKSSFNGVKYFKGQERGCYYGKRKN